MTIIFLMSAAGVGFVGGLVTALLFFMPKTVGTIIIDMSDPAKDNYLLDVEDNLDTLPKQKAVSFKIKVKTERMFNNYRPYNDNDI